MSEKCGCQVVLSVGKTYKDVSDLQIVHCPLHSSAAQMREALEIAVEAHRLWQEDPTFTGNQLGEAMNVARRVLFSSQGPEVKGVKP